MAGRNHHIARRQPFQHFNLCRPTHAELDLDQRRLAVDHAINRRFRPWHDSLFRHHQDIGPIPEKHADADEHAGPQLAGRVIEPGATQNGPPTFVHQRVDGIKRRLETFAGQGIACHFDGLPLDQLREIGFGQFEISQQDIDGFDIDQILSVLDVIADTDIAQAEHTLERRLDPRLGDLGIGQLHGGFLHLQCCGGAIQRLLAEKLLADQFFIALKAALRQCQVGPRLLQLGLLDRGIQRNEHRTGRDNCTVLEIHTRHAPGHLRAQHHGFPRFQRTDSHHIIDEITGLDRHHLNRHGRTTRTTRPPWSAPAFSGSRHRCRCTVE